MALFAASVDTPEAIKSFAQSLGVDYPVLSDPTKVVARAYGVIDEGQAFTMRWTYFIGVDGRLLHVDKGVKPTSHGRDIAAKLAELGVPRRRTGAARSPRPVQGP